MNYKIGFNRLLFTVNPTMSDTNSFDTLEKQILTTVNKLVTRVEKEVPESGFFRPLQEDFTDTNPRSNIGRVSFQIAPPASEKVECSSSTRFFKVVIFTPSGANKASQILFDGTKNEIVDLLKKTDTVKKIQKLIGNATGLFLRDELS